MNNNTEQGLTIGIIGMGFMGSVHAAHYLDNPQVRQILVTSPVAEERELAKKKYGAIVYEDYQEMVREGKPDGVSICTPNFDHSSVASWLLKEAPGSGILIEKPIGVNQEQVDTLLNTAKDVNSTVLVGHSLRFANAYALGRELLLTGEIGAPVYLEGRYKWFKDFNRFPAWKRSPELSGGGFLMQSGLHMLDLFLWYASAPVTEVIGRSSNLYFKDAAIEDTFIAEIYFKSGVMAHLVGSSATKGFIDYGIEIYGTSGAIKVESVAIPGGLDIDNHAVRLFKENSELSPNGALTIPTIPKSDFWKDEINHFINCLLGKEKPIVNLNDAKVVMDLCFALYESARLNGKTIKL